MFQNHHLLYYLGQSLLLVGFNGNPGRKRSSYGNGPVYYRDDCRIDVAFSFRGTSRRHSVVARHTLGRGSSLFEGIFPLNEPIRARLFLLAPKPKSRRHHINKGWAWFEANKLSLSFGQKALFHVFENLLRIEDELNVFP